MAIKGQRWLGWPGRLWVGYGTLGLLILMGGLIWAPQHSQSLLMGVLLGGLYQAQLIHWTKRLADAKGSSQWLWVASLSRVVVLSAVIAWVGGGDVEKTAVVICGFLSYKGGALAETGAALFFQQASDQSESV